MNRRKLFGWLTALPFLPAVLAKTTEVSGDLYAKPIAFPAPTANWGTVSCVSIRDELWIVGDRTIELWTDDHSWLRGDQWSPAEQEIFKSREVA